MYIENFVPLALIPGSEIITKSSFWDRLYFNLIFHPAPAVLAVLGLLMIFRTHWMLETTRLFEKALGAEWVPSEFTFVFYRTIGIVLVGLSSGWFGYVWR